MKEDTDKPLRLAFLQETMDALTEEVFFGRDEEEDVEELGFLEDRDVFCRF